MTRYDASDRAPLKPLFDENHPNRSMLVSFLNSDIPGEAYVDSVESPRCCFVVLDFLNWSFVGGDFRGQLPEYLAELTKTKDITLVWNAETSEREPEGYAERIARAEFSNTDFRKLNQPSAPQGPFRIVPITDSTFDSCLWKDLMVLGYGTKEGFLRHSGSYSLLVDDKAASDVYVSFFAEGSFELGVVTAEEYRRKGYSFEVARHGINEANRRGFRTTWSCDRENQASFDLARKLGYTHLREYEMLYFRTSHT